MTDKEFIQEALERFKLSAAAESKIRQNALDDFDFRIGKQWPGDIETQRNLDGRPCLVMNRLPQFIKQVTNEQRQQRPSIVINPVGSGADVDTAEILQGVARHIEVNSEAEIAYDTGFEHMVTGGFGYWRLITEYADDKSFNQEIKFRRIANPFTVYFDPFAVLPDRSDAMWCFIVEDIPTKTFKSKYKGTELASLDNFESLGDATDSWAGQETCRVAEYYYIEEETQKLYQIGDSVTSVLPEGMKESDVKSREVVTRKVKWAKIDAIEKIEERDIPGKWIPVVPVLGDELDVNGERVLSGIVRNAKDPQRMYNYWESAATETIALAPKAPTVGAEGQFENHENQWSQSNVRNFAYLEYKPVSVNGQPIGPPQRNAIEPPIQAMAAMLKLADNDLKATTGIYDASLGEKGPDQSGRAILARQKQGDVANLNYTDNLSRAIRHTGRIILGWIPEIYDAPRIQRIINPDQSVDHVAVFNSAKTGLSKEQVAESLQVKKVFDVGLGEYDVTISVGPSYQSKRQEAVATQLELLKALPPQAGQAVMDIVTRNMDIPQSNEIADRLKKLLPPQLQDGADDDPEAQLMKTQAQLQGLAQQHDLLVKTVNDLTETLKTRQVEQNAKIQIARLEQTTKESIVKMQEATKIAVAQMNASKDMHEGFAQREVDVYSLLQGQAHEAAMGEAEAAQAQQMAEQQQMNQPQPQEANA